VKRTIDDIIEDIVDGAIEFSEVISALMLIVFAACFSARHLLLVIIALLVLFWG